MHHPSWSGVALLPFSHWALQDGAADDMAGEASLRTQSSRQYGVSVVLTAPGRREPVGLVTPRPHPSRHGTWLKSKGGWLSTLSSQMSGDCSAAVRASRLGVKSKYSSSLIIPTVGRSEVKGFPTFRLFGASKGRLLPLARTAAQASVEVSEPHLKVFGDVPLLRRW